MEDTAGGEIAGIVSEGWGGSLELGLTGVPCRWQRHVWEGGICLPVQESDL